MNKKQNTERLTRDTENAESEKAVGLSCGLGAYFSDKYKIRTPESLPPYYYAVYKASIISVEIMGLLDKLKAYNKLYENNLNLPQNDEAWKFIDETYEYYQDSYNNSQLSVDLLHRKLNHENQ